MLDNTHCFFIVEGSANCFGTVHIMFVVPIFFSFFVVFECISSNIVKRDMALCSDEVRILFFSYTLSLFSQNSKPRLVMPKFQASISVYRAAKLLPPQPVPCYPKIFKLYLCLVVLRKLPPSQPTPCYPKITTRAKTPTSCEILTREMPVIPLNPKNHLAQIGGGVGVKTCGSRVGVPELCI